jgi:hypothetical protein
MRLFFFFVYKNSFNLQYFIMLPNANIVHETKEQLLNAMAYTVGTVVDELKSRTFLWYKEDDGCLLLAMHRKEFVEGYTRLPNEMTISQSTDFAWGWLEHHNPTEPQTSGACLARKGFQLKTGQALLWGHECHCSIKPVWLMDGQ